MLRRLSVCSALLALGMSTDCQPEKHLIDSSTPSADVEPADASSQRDSSGPRHLGTMDGYYRNTAVLDRTLAAGRMMWRIPEWMTRTDFPYAKSAFPTEAPFTDAVTTVRILGGWRGDQLPDDRNTDSNDLVQRDENGELFYRWDLLKARLDAYVDRGYEITLVLDNVPFALARDPKVEGFGQISPPANMEAWYRFIRGLAEELERLYGTERANQFRFRVGTEMQDQRRFDGTYEDYLQFYDYAAKAVKEVLPEAGFGPFNRSIPKGSFTDFGSYVGGNVSIVALAEHAASGTNRATGETGSPFEFLARSLYYFSSIDEEGTFVNFDPDERLPEFTQLWERVEAIDPKYAGLSREVHELGPHLNTEGGIYGLDTGARGAAQTLDTLVGLREIGTDRIWHWELFENINAGHTLLMSQGWLYSIFDHMRGGEEYSVPVEADSEDPLSRQRGYLSVKENEAILLVANWHVNRLVEESADLRVELPYAILPTDMDLAGAIHFNEQSSVYDVIRADLAGAGLLAQKHVDHEGKPATTLFSKGYTSMSSDAGAVRAFVLENWERYAALMMQSLELGDFAGRIEPEKAGRTIRWTGQTPSVQVLVFRKTAPSTANQTGAAIEPDNRGITPLGTLDPFWRYSAALGPWHEVAQGLHIIPEHALAGDFPYRKRPFPKEVPFADHLSVVRILGGFNDGSDKGEGNPSVRARDLAFRDAEGKIQTRFELLEPRLRPYLDNGYTEFTFVLDNVPFAFPETPAVYALGQYQPPADMREWNQFVSDFCRKLEELLPAEALASIRFRVGTEMQDTRRFGGTQEQYEAFYAASVAGIREVLPSAKISFYNIAGANVFGIEERHNINSFNLVADNLYETNPFADGLTPAIDFISFSRYFSMGMDLVANAAGAGEVWEEFERRFPELRDVPREIHEFGVAPWGEQSGGDGFVSQEPGPLGAATTAIMIGHLRAAGIDALWHWPGELIDWIRDSRGKRHDLFTGVAWLYQILETMRGGESYLIPLEVPELPSGQAIGLLSLQSDSAILLVAGYDRGLGETETRSLRVPLPAGALKGKDAESLRIVRLDRDSSVHRRIRDDLAGAGLLKPAFEARPDRLGTVRQMITRREDETFIGNRFGQYAELYARSLHLRGVADTDGIWIEPDTSTLSITLQLPSVAVLVWSR
jgi:hypothetical protein